MFKAFARRAALAAAISAVAFGTMGFQSNDGKDRRVLIINGTSITMSHFYASNSDAGDWEEDIFGGYTLASGASVLIDIDDGTGACIYDLKAMFPVAAYDGGYGQVVTFSINVCEVAEYRFTGERMTPVPTSAYNRNR